MKEFTVFHDHLLPELPGCTVAMVNLHLLQVAREFCDRTSVWRGDFYVIPALADTLTYSLDTPELKTNLVRLLKLTVNDVLMWCHLQPPDSAAQPRFPPDQPPFYISHDNLELTLNEQPEGDIVLYGSMKPATNATRLPDMLAGDWLEAMRAGVLSRLMAMGKKPWTDRDLASAYRSAYERDVQFAAAKADGGNTRKPLRTRKSPI